MSTLLRLELLVEHSKQRASERARDDLKVSIFLTHRRLKWESLNCKVVLASRLAYFETISASVELTALFFFSFKLEAPRGECYKSVLVHVVLVQWRLSLLTGTMALQCYHFHIAALNCYQRMTPSLMC